ncbi:MULTISPECIES: hypothetical protein [unclassified Streptomyces]|uniref:hypothetical protein n=1 Tax=unclassified Streptomyces TaxID=2593676 RepID=UPI0013A69625|nr:MULTISPECIES: hypothetical protein [unclassified Streptomyces]QZZ27740.1 hypothetical protein A7X85_16940 [Streptomyces sp. ST1015]
MRRQLVPALRRRAHTHAPPPTASSPAEASPSGKARPDPVLAMDPDGAEEVTAPEEPPVAKADAEGEAEPPPVEPPPVEPPPVELPPVAPEVPPNVTGIRTVWL